jgi:hypothetical protein
MGKNPTLVAIDGRRIDELDKLRVKIWAAAISRRLNEPKGNGISQKLHEMQEHTWMKPKPNKRYNDATPENAEPQGGMGNPNQWSARLSGKMNINIETLAIVEHFLPGSAAVFLDGPPDTRLWKALETNDPEVLDIIDKNSDKVDGHVARLRLSMAELNEGYGDLPEWLYPPGYAEFLIAEADRDSDIYEFDWAFDESTWNIPRLWTTGTPTSDPLGIDLAREGLLCIFLSLRENDFSVEICDDIMQFCQKRILKDLARGIIRANREANSVAVGADMYDAEQRKIQEEEAYSHLKCTTIGIKGSRNAPKKSET